jgi:hypothetical protein
MRGVHRSYRRTMNLIRLVIMTQALWLRIKATRCGLKVHGLEKLEKD